MVFAGYCAGGLIAYEMAHQAMAAGDVVMGAILLDTACPDDALAISLTTYMVGSCQDLQGSPCCSMPLRSERGVGVSICP
jgi:thioesterase domain-containing protein